MKNTIESKLVIKALAAVGTVAFTLAGCNAKTAVAPKEALEAAPLDTIELTTYETEPMRLGDVKMFLWRDGTTPDQVEEVLDSSSTVDTIEKEMPTLKVEYDEVQAKMNVSDKQAALQKQKDDANAELSNTNAEIYQKTEKDEKDLALNQQMVDKYQPEYDELVAQLKAEESKPKPNATTVKAIKTKMKAYDDPKTGKLATKVEKIKKIKERLANAEVEIVPLKEKLKSLEANLKNCDEELAGIQRIKDEYEPILKPIKEKYEARQQQYIDSINRLTSVVDWYNDKPDAFTFSVDAGGFPTVSVSKWDLLDGAGPRNYDSDSENSPIVNVSYNPRGAVFKFDLETSKGGSAIDPVTKDSFVFDETYSFKLSRAKDREGDSRKFFQGDMIRTRKMTFSGGRVVKDVRRGAIKLATE